ncbi:methylmalonyl Co-A mutase-associated GTPase MeaB [Pseudobacteriovorax antillogorgiicola]|uniref:Methylmalonyl-CoA mutase metallochaperone MeaB n=1 Tax=Pseudobacteriovorax antillogorgiicola TaxID=1513793 RepID=A0A1Y6B8A3_9BACT|nr:methylmalonyl Co-A mutase-associated GTPase MeaB [Pseudobacteriovorax antillogorgiicola]TCS59304.1 methylmalonyl-CoA mutase metallochaperone MeaB [Pseudobacteriovorax antillogorgiicola]SME89575.1 methylmalonyl-CoA mutase metallochaperone MeaB [Pseudobacteriovorax antillogorgiicola]
MTDNLFERLLSGERRALGKAITLIESQSPKHRAEANALMDQVMKAPKPSIRIGISGTPGAGKSTFIEAFGMALIEKGHKVAVLAVDPSSPISSGSILGDKTRMQHLSAHPQAFIRPSPAGRHLGGVASRTREAIYLCEAANYDFIIVETVGVGQSEHLVHSMVDAFIYLQLPNSGDQLQGIKKGILELAHLILVNKCDGKHVQAAKRAKTDLDLALNLIYQNRPEERPEVILMSALEKTGLDQVYQQILALIDGLKSNEELHSRRAQQALDWYRDEVQRLLVERVFENEDFKRLYQEAEASVARQEKSARQAAFKFTNALMIGSK